MAAPLSPAEEALREAAREYHRSPVRGKISITPTKPLLNQRDLSLAYSPGVAYPCLDIAADPSTTDASLRGFLNTTPHMAMPKLKLTARDQDDVIAYILSLQPARGR